MSYFARYYDPTVGQFLTVDPAVATTLSPYGYLAGNPLNGTDPSGDCGGLFGFVCTAWDATGGKVVNYVEQHPQAVRIGLGVVAVAVGLAATGGAGLMLISAADALDASSLLGLSEAYEFGVWAAPITLLSGITAIAGGSGLIYLGATYTDAANTDASLSGGAYGCSTR